MSNTPISITIPVDIITKFLPKGLNQEGFGGVINSVPQKTDINIVTMLVKIITGNFIFIDNRPAVITNKNVPDCRIAGRGERAISR
ncbi:hypothetical protein J7E35_11485 [Bacillus sp. ISL-45]|nr:hypothetical protein [Bacillus sp. ISL-45]